MRQIAKRLTMEENRTETVRKTGKGKNYQVVWQKFIKNWKANN